MEFYNEENCEKVEQILIKEGLLKFDGVEKLSNKFLNFELFFNLNNSNDTVNLKGEIVCYYNKFRSIGDVYRILKYYYPDLKLSELRRKICLNKKIEHSYCPDVRKIVLMYNRTRTYKYVKLQEDEFGYHLEKSIVQNLLCTATFFSGWKTYLKYYLD